MKKISLCVLTALILMGCSSSKVPVPHGSEFPINSDTKVTK
ncbi:hypothetical protein [Snodgrassella alvi]|nr:hypothetical protein [Snodgrassella alvi]